MADAIQLEVGTDRILMEDGLGVVLLEVDAGAALDDLFPYVGGGYYPA